MRERPSDQRVEDKRERWSSMSEKPSERMGEGGKMRERDHQRGWERAEEERETERVAAQ